MASYKYRTEKLNPLDLKNLQTFGSDGWRVIHIFFEGYTTGLHGISTPHYAVLLEQKQDEKA